MLFTDFKNHLIKNNILLFDDQYRITYKNTIDLLKEINNDKNKINYICPFNIIKNEEKKKIKLLIDSLKNNNIIGAKYICKSDLQLNYFYV
jgi:CRISPR/Cas system-associated protein Cas7 (RAMP superfamily)